MNKMTGIPNDRRFTRAMMLCAAVCWGLTLLFWKLAPFLERDPKQLEGLTSLGVEYYWPEYDMPVYLVMCVFSLVTTSITGYLALRRNSFPEVEPPTLTTAKASSSPYFDIAFILFLFSVIWIPNATLLIETAYNRDQFHHLNFYIMGPLQMYQQGAALGTEAYTQYESGWIILFSALGKFTTIDHPFVIQVLSFFAAIYFSVWYLVIRKLGFNAIWAVLCILVCLLVQYFLFFQNPANYTPWETPATTVCRNPTDAFVMLSLLFLYDTNKLRYAFVAGFFVGLGVLFGNDTGVYVAAAAFGSCALRLLDRRVERRQTFRESTALALTAVATALLGLAIASRGTLLQPDFWSGYYEAVRNYSSGFSALTIRGFLNIELTQLYWSVLFLCTLVIYTVTLSRVAVLALMGKASRLEPLFAFIGIIGFGTLIYFINRSHFRLLEHSMVPAIVLWFVEFLRFIAGENSRALSQPSKTADRWGLLLCVACLGIMFVRESFRDNPSLLNTWTGNFSGESPTHEYRDLVEQLPQIKRDIEKRLGQQPYALVGEDTVLWLMAFNQQSPTRYLPMLVITRAQQEAMLKELEDENLILCKRLHKYRSGDDLTRMLERKFVLIESTPDYDIYRRKDLPPLTLQPVDSESGK